MVTSLSPHSFRLGLGRTFQSQTGKTESSPAAWGLCQDIDNVHEGFLEFYANIIDTLTTASKIYCFIEKWNFCLFFIQTDKWPSPKIKSGGLVRKHQHMGFKWWHQILLDRTKIRPPCFPWTYNKTCYLSANFNNKCSIYFSKDRDVSVHLVFYIFQKFFSELGLINK